MPSVDLRINNALVTDEQHEEGREYLRTTLKETRKRILATEALRLARFIEVAEVGDND
jgi:hypothetical protein